MEKAISKLSDKCQRCKHVNKCDEKRMMLCAVAEQIADYKPIMEPITQQITMPILQPILRDDSIAARIAEQMRIDFYKPLHECAFKR